jgi:hypothetical protein
MQPALRLEVQARPYPSVGAEKSTYSFVATNATKFELLLRNKLAVPAAVRLDFTANLEEDGEDVAPSSVDLDDVFALVYRLRQGKLFVGYGMPTADAPDGVVPSSDRGAYHAPRAPRPLRPSLASGSAVQRSGARPEPEKMTLLQIRKMHTAVKDSENFLQYKGGGACAR